MKIDEGPVIDESDHRLHPPLHFNYPCAACGHGKSMHGVSSRERGALFDGIGFCREGAVQDGPDSYKIVCPCGHYEEEQR